MGSLGYILGGAMQGIGAGLVQRGQAEAEAAKQSAIERREMALAQFQHERSLERDNKQSELRRGDMAVQAGYRRDELKTAAELDDWKSARNTSRTTASQIEIDNARTNNDKALARLNSQLTLSREQQIEAQKLVNDLTLAGKEVGHQEVAADGSLVIYSKTGVLLGRTKPGQFVPKSAGDVPLTNPFGAPQAKPTASPAPKATQAPPRAPAAPPKPPANRPPLSAFDSADPEKDKRVVNTLFM